jgi:hypothetical protein
VFSVTGIIRSRCLSYRQDTTRRRAERPGARTRCRGRYQVLDDAHHTRREHGGARGEDAGQLGPEEAQALAESDATFQHERTGLIDDAGALRDEPLAHPIQRLQIQLISRLRRHELHCWPLYGLGNRLASRKSFFSSIPIRHGGILASRASTCPRDHF